MITLVVLAITLVTHHHYYHTPATGSPTPDRSPNRAYSLADYELLDRTPSSCDDAHRGSPGYRIMLTPIRASRSKFRVEGDTPGEWLTAKNPWPVEQ